MEALNAKGAKPSHAESFFFNRLLAICLGVLYFIEASFRVYFCHDIFSSPLFKTSVVEIDDEANGELHEDNRRLMSRSTFFNARQSVQLVLQTKVLPEECLKT
jgi:hypothetical protein